MLKAAKVFIIISMILGCFLIIPIIVGAIALNKLDSVQKKDELLGIGIITLLLCSIIAGIIILCLSDNDLKDSNSFRNQNGLTKYEQSLVDSMVDAMDDDSNEIPNKLRELKSLYDEGIIDEKTYKEKKEKYLELL